jgi:uncharacterized protein
MGLIPKSLQPFINSAYPDYTILVASVLADGYAQVTPRGSVFVYDDDHFAMWERGIGSTNQNLRDGTRLTFLYRNMDLREQGVLPRGGIARFYGEAKLYRDGPVREAVYNGMIAHEQARDPQKQGFAVLVRIERAEHIDGKPLA